MRFSFILTPLIVHACVLAETPAEQAPETIPLAHVEVRGSGAVPMILIPGLMFDWTVFDSFMTRNAERYRMYAVTLPGFGKSGPPPTPAADQPFGATPWLSNAERAIVDLIRRMEIRNPVVVGHSMGGHLALRIGLHHPDLVRSVATIDGFPVYPLGGVGKTIPQEERESLARSLFEGLVATPRKTWREQQRQWVKQMVTDPAQGDALADIAVAVPTPTACRYMAELMASDLSGALADLRTPALFIAAIPPEGVFGMNSDQIIGMWKEFASPSDKITLAVFRDCQHFVTHDAPDQLDRAIERWVKGEPVEGNVKADD